MKLPEDSNIAPEKLTRYLLVPQARGDKSAYLALAGYTLDNFTTLLTDLRAQILNQDATALETTSYGQLYEIRARFGTHPACANHLDDRILERRDEVHYPDPRLGALKT